MATNDSTAEQTTHEPVVVRTESKSNQTALTIAIVSAVVLFFMGLGLGYVLGHATSEQTRFPGSRLQFPGDGDGRRLYPNSRSNTDTNTGTGSSSNTNTNTQTN
jgi:hypothetical protein